MPLSALEVRVSARVEKVERALDAKQRKKLDWWYARLKADIFAGTQIPKDRIPGSLSVRNGLPGPLANAWRFELPGAIRGIYTIQPSAARHPVVLILEILSHKEYDRLFGYR